MGLWGGGGSVVDGEGVTVKGAWNEVVGGWKVIDPIRTLGRNRGNLHMS